jgi:natural product biosynthesis luciferase-like monooxygenase protein
MPKSLSVTTTGVTGASYALSPMQQGMLFQSQLSPDSGVDIQQMVVTLHEDIDVSKLQQAWARVVARHDVLRTGFHWQGLAEPVQEVHPAVELPFVFDDRSHLPRAEQTQRLEAYLIEDRRQGFDYTQPPLMRVALFKEASQHYTCVWTFHHMVLDGRSHTMLIREVFACYAALRKGEELEAPRPRPYREFIHWLRWSQPAQAEQFWRQLLQGFTAPTPLQVRRGDAPEARQGQAFGVETLALSVQATERLKAWTAHVGISPYTLVLGAWSLLLSRYSGERDIVFGTVRAGRRGTVDGADEMVGLLINTVPMRVDVSPDQLLVPWLSNMREQQRAVAQFEHTPLVKVQGWSDVPRGTPLFESLVVFENYRLISHLRTLDSAWATRELELLENPGYPLTLYGYLDREFLFKLHYSQERFDPTTIRQLLRHLQGLVEGMLAVPAGQLVDIPMLSPEEQQQLLLDWNTTAVDVPAQVCVHHAFEQQAARTPAAPAVVYEDEEITYYELDSRANQLAQYLRKLGVRADVLVGLCVERSIDMVVGVLGIHKAGGAYIPLDPTYPHARLAYMLADSEAPVLVTQRRLRGTLPPYQGQVVYLDSGWEEIAQEPTGPVASGVKPEHLAYVIYTSGSTGHPKGVMVEHRNVVNFFAGMDAHIRHIPGDVWLAVTSLSFDISVLELFWTLSRGLKVVLAGEREQPQGAPTGPSRSAQHGIDFSLFYFSADASANPANLYRLLLEGAQFADANGFAAVWTPERHFHAFGGLYPNPSVTSAALATVTKRLQLRSGSVVAPLHSPLRIAEEWAVVDNLSNGRVAISFASGWMPEDFVLRPETFASRKEVMFQTIDTVRRLWRGERMAVPGPLGQDVMVQTLPRPVQAELPVWVTTAGNPDTYRMAGAIGANVLTHLLGQSLAEVAEKIAIYRQAWQEHGHAGRGHVTLMLHTFVSDCPDFVRAMVRQPLTEYLRTSADLIKQYSWSFPVFTRQSQSMEDINFANVSQEEMDALLDHAFNRYFETSGLFGTPETCRAMIDRVQASDIDEVACLIDFGVSPDVVLANLPHLNALRELCSAPPQPERQPSSIPALIQRHGVTHFQCTPTMASMLCMDVEARAALRSLQHVMIGGEAFPDSLAVQLQSVVQGEILNMYGPTETTIWSSTYALQGREHGVSIGRPIANTQFYILDQNRQPVPIGVAGELLIGGAGVARGYLNRPALTAERFLRDPFCPQAEAHLYRTGDLVRYRPDGNVEFIGRLDHQVKIRGHRIELAEIEAQLNQHVAVRESVVLAREDVPGDQRLVAYVVTRGSQSPGPGELRDYLKERLPGYMVPAFIVFIDSFQQTPNKKIDRKGLPPPEKDQRDLEVNFEPPHTELEARLAQIWAEVLGVAHVGRQDHFFDLGGHSLLAVGLINRVEKVFGTHLPLTTLLRSPTVEKMAGVLQEKGEAGPKFLTHESTWIEGKI